jgi:hypothetical protein
MAEQTSNTSSTETPVTPASPAPQTSTDTASSGQSQSAKLLTQSEVDFQLGERAKRATESATKKILSELGLTSVDEIATLKQVIENAKKRDEADLSATERADKALKAEQDRAKLLEQQLSAERTARRNQTIDSALKSKAIGASDPDLLILHLRTAHAEAVNALLSDEGTLNDKKLTDLLAQAKQEKPILFGVSQTPGIPSNRGGTSTPPNTKIDISKFRI